MDVRRPAGSQIGTLGTLLLVSLLATIAIAETCDGPVAVQDCLAQPGALLLDRLGPIQ